MAVDAGYRTPRSEASQTRGRRRIEPVTSPIAAARTLRAPPAIATHGPSHGDVKAGGSTIASTDAATITAANVNTAASTDRRRRGTSVVASVRTAATAATSDHRNVSPHEIGRAHV